MREAAVLLLEREGLRGFSNSVRLDEALEVLLAQEDVRLTHGSIYGRIWNDQRDFQLDVVATAVSRYRGEDIGHAIDAAAALGSDPAPVLIGRLFGAAVATARRSRRWNLWIGASAAVVSTPGTEDDERLADALARARTGVTSRVGEALASALGPASWPQFGDLFVNLVIGASVTGETRGAADLLTAALSGPSASNMGEPGRD